MSNIQIYKKPELAVLSNEKKLRSYNDVERLTIAKEIIENLLNSLGVGNKSNEEHHVAAIKYVEGDKYFTPSEFEKAFELVLNGVLKIELYQQVNCLIIGKVMNLYRIHRNENLKIYNQKLQLQKNNKKELSLEEKQKLFFNTLKDEFESFKSSGTINEMRNWLYDELIKFDLKVDDPNKKIIWKHSIAEIRVVQIGLKKVNKYSNETLKAKAIIIYKRKLIESMFSKFTNYEQLLNKLK